MNTLVAKRILSNELPTSRAQRKRASDMERRDQNIEGALPRMSREREAATVRGYLADQLAHREALSRRRKRQAKELVGK